MITNNIDKIGKFINEVRSLCESHGLFLDGKLRVRQGKEWDGDTFSITHKDEIDYGYAKDSTGPFICFSINKLTKLTDFEGKKVNMQIVDKDKLLRDGVKSMADGKIYGNRHEYNEHLKRNGFIEVGDQAPTKPNREVRGDFEVRGALKDALQKHL